MSSWPTPMPDPNIRLVVLRSDGTRDTFDSNHTADATSGTLIITGIMDELVAGYSATSWARFFYEPVPSVPDYAEDGDEAPAVGAI
jgi:hypothetical protein